MFEALSRSHILVRPLRRCPFWQTGGWMSGVGGYTILYVWDVCAGESSPPPSPPSCQYLSASASTGGWHEGTQKQTMREDCNFCATALFIFVFWQNHRVLWCWCSHFCISLLFTLHPVPVQTYSGYRPNTVFAASATQSNWNLYFAPGVGVKRLGLTKFAMKFCTSLQCWRMSL